MGTASKAGGVALALAMTALAPAAGAETAGAMVTAKVVKPFEVSAAVATEWLNGGSPGVFTLRIPGAATGTIALTVSTVEGSSGTVAFATSSEPVGAMQQLIAQIAASQLTPLRTYQVSGIATSGTLNGEGVQVIVMKANQNGDGSGTVVAIITFD
jgi:hypothetical protein